MIRDSFHYELGVFMFNALHPDFADINTGKYDIEENFIRLLQAAELNINYLEVSTGFIAEAENHGLRGKYIEDMFKTDVEFLTEQ